MKTSILFALLATSIFAESAATLDLEGEISHGDSKEITLIGLGTSHFKVQAYHKGAGKIRSEVLQAMEAEPALKLYAHSAAWPIHVNVEQSVVTLEGIVDSDAAEIQADVAADSVPAVTRVFSHLQVVSAEASTAKSVNHQKSTSGE